MKKGTAMTDPIAQAAARAREAADAATARIAKLERELATTAAELATLKAQELPADWSAFLALPWAEQERHRKERPEAVRTLERKYFAVLNAGGRPR